MPRGSLRIRLIVSAVITTALAIAAAGAALVVLVDRHVERRIVYEMRGYLDQIARQLQPSPEARLPSTSLADNRFTQLNSGLYWLVLENGAVIARSTSLGDQSLDLPPERADGARDRAYQIPGPSLQTLLVVERSVAPDNSDAGRRWRILVAEDRADVDEVVSEFAMETAAFLTLLVGFLALAGWINVTVGLKPLEGLRDLILDVRRGRAKRLTGRFPEEVGPLVDELNGLIAAQEKALESARARAGDLAHGLKTPLAILSSEARSLRERGEARAAEAIEAEVTAMSRFVERELARARAGATGYGQRLDLAPVVDRIVAAMMRLPRGDEIEWTVDMPRSVGVALNREDATEIIANVLDNARKWATSRIEMRVEAGADLVVLKVADDGPGVPAERREAVLMRGIRLDETVQGSGLGLSIVDDLVTSYGGRLSLATRPGGGLVVEIVLPGAGDAPA